MIGMMLGGIVWGYWRQKRKIKSSVWLHLIVFSCQYPQWFCSNLATVHCDTIHCRLWLAGELGAGITLTSEILPKEKRGLAATVIAATGVVGALPQRYCIKRSRLAHLVFVGGAWALCY